MQMSETIFVGLISTASVLFGIIVGAVVPWFREAWNNKENLELSQTASSRTSDAASPHCQLPEGVLALRASWPRHTRRTSTIKTVDTSVNSKLNT